MTVEFSRPRLSRAVAWALALTSFLITILIGRVSVACHLPFAADVERSRALLRLNRARPHTWRAIDVLVSGCRCSRGVAEHLAARGRIPGLDEAVVLVGEDKQISQLIHKSSLPLAFITPAESSGEFHLEGAPYLLILAPDDSVRYAGGYAADRNVGNGYQDASIWRTVSSGGSYPPLPIFGCAAGVRAKRAIDPLGLKSIF